jgi:histidinol dehydrogenase
MPLRLATTQSDFAARFEAFLLTKRETSDDVEVAVKAILADVGARGAPPTFEH